MVMETAVRFVITLKEASSAVVVLGMNRTVLSIALVSLIMQLL